MKRYVKIDGVTILVTSNKPPVYFIPKTFRGCDLRAWKKQHKPELKQLL